MKHRWEITKPPFHRHRRCIHCGVMQVYSSGTRRIASSVSGGWYPPAGRCGLVDLKLRRVRHGRYETEDGRFRVGLVKGWWLIYFGAKLVLEAPIRSYALEWLATNAVELVQKQKQRENLAVAKKRTKKKQAINVGYLRKLLADPALPDEALILPDWDELPNDDDPTVQLGSLSIKNDVAVGRYLSVGVSLRPLNED